MASCQQPLIDNLEGRSAEERQAMYHGCYEGKEEGRVWRAVSRSIQAKFILEP